MGEADEGTAQGQERLMNIRPPLIPDRQPAIPMEPRQRPLDHPAMAAQPFARFNALARDPDPDPALVQEPPAAGDAVRLVVTSQLLTCLMAGYAFARFNFPFRETIFILFLATLMIPHQITIIPTYLIMRDLGWLDTHLALIVPPALFSAFGVFLMRQFIKSLPEELEESAILDGANRWRIYWQINVPLIKAPLAALAIFSFLAQWKSELRALGRRGAEKPRGDGENG